MLRFPKIVLCTAIAFSWFSPFALAQENDQNSAVSDAATADYLYNRAYRVYEYARNEKDYYLSKKSYKNAETGFRDFIAEFPREPRRQQSEYYIAVCQMLTGNLASGEANMERIIRKYKTGHWVGASAYRMGVQKYNGNAFITAANFFKIASENYEKQNLADLALYQHSRALLTAKRYDLAVKPLEKLAESKTPYRDNSRYALAKIYYDAEQYDKALPHFKVLSETQNLDAKITKDAFLFYGLSLSRSGNIDEALKVLKRSLDSPSLAAPDKAKVQHEVVKILYNKGEYDAVIVQFDRGLYAGEPATTAKTYMLAGYCLLKKGYYNRAASAFGTVSDVVPDTQEGFEASYRRIYCYYQIDSASVPALADSFYNRYSKRDRDNVWHYLVKVYKAESLYNTGLIKDAAKTYLQIESTKLPKSLEPNFLYKKLICLTESEDYARAIKSASHFLSLYGNHNLAHEVTIRRGDAFLASNNTTAAATDYEKVLDDLPESPLTAIALQGLIKVYSRTNRYKELVDSCELLIGKFPKLDQQALAHANYWLGWGHFKLEEFDKAIEPLSKARRISPDFYKEPSGTRILYATYYLKDSKAMKVAYNRILLDVPGKYFPPKMLAWLGVQSYQNKDYFTARKVLDEIANRDAPSETPIDVWRYLAKSHLKLNQNAEALEALKIVLKQEESEFWKADTYLDIATASLSMAQYEDAITHATKGLEYKPLGAVEASLRLTRAEANSILGNLIKAKDELMLVAGKFQDDQEVHPVALWKAAQLLKLQDPDSSNALESTLRQQYPNWSPSDN